MLMDVLNHWSRHSWFSIARSADHSVSPPRSLERISVVGWVEKFECVCIQAFVFSSCQIFCYVVKRCSAQKQNTWYSQLEILIFFINVNCNHTFWLDHSGSMTVSIVRARMLLLCNKSVIQFRTSRHSKYESSHKEHTAKSFRQDNGDHLCGNDERLSRPRENVVAPCTLQNQ